MTSDVISGACVSCVNTHGKLYRFPTVWQMVFYDVK